MRLRIAHLYPNLLNIYGDRGNIICLKNRCQWRGIKVRVTSISINDKLITNNYDLYFGGGGQDRQQMIVADDLQKKKKVLKQEASRGVPMLTICGTYQLFGHYFKTHTGIKIPGISIFDAYTVASHKRKIGNIVIKANPSISQSASWRISISRQSDKSDCLVGFENHSGNTFIGQNFQQNSQGVLSKTPLRCTSLDTSTFPLGKIIKGFGNNGQDKTEGAIYKNVFGCYLHGSLLPKNPHFADLLIKKALEVKYKKKITLKPLDDTLEWQAHKAALSR